MIDEIYLGRSGCVFLLSAYCMGSFTGVWEAQKEIVGEKATLISLEGRQDKT